MYLDESRGYRRSSPALRVLAYVHSRDASGTVAQGGGVPQTAYSPTRLTFPDTRQYSASAAARFGSLARVKSGRRTPPAHTDARRRARRYEEWTCGSLIAERWPPPEAAAQPRRSYARRANG